MKTFWNNIVYTFLLRNRLGIGVLWIDTITQPTHNYTDEAKLHPASGCRYFCTCMKVKVRYRNRFSSRQTHSSQGYQAIKHSD